MTENAINNEKTLNYLAQELVVLQNKSKDENNQRIIILYTYYLLLLLLQPLCEEVLFFIIIISFFILISLFYFLLWFQSNQVPFGTLTPIAWSYLGQRHSLYKFRRLLKFLGAFAKESARKKRKALIREIFSRTGRQFSDYTGQLMP